jgi:hypothetical protein
MSRSLIPNSTQIPDVILDHWMAALSGAEFKVLMYIARRTYGFGKDGDNVSLAQITGGIVRKDGVVLDRGTGLTKTGVCKALDALEQRGLVKRRQRDSKKSGHLPTFYSLNLEAGLPPPLVNSVNKGGLSTELTSPCQLTTQALVNSVDIQETEKQETEKQETAAAPTPLAEPPKRRKAAKNSAAAVSEGREKDAPEAEKRLLVEALIAADLNRTDAERLAVARPDECRLQLAYLPFKPGLENPGGYLRRAIEGGFPAPKEYKAARAREERERRKREEAQRTKAREAAQKAQEAAEALRRTRSSAESKKEAPEAFAGFLRYVERKKAEARDQVSEHGAVDPRPNACRSGHPTEAPRTLTEWQALPRQEPPARGEWQQLSIPTRPCPGTGTAARAAAQRGRGGRDRRGGEQRRARVADLIQASLGARSG